MSGVIFVVSANFIKVSFPKFSTLIYKKWKFFEIFIIDGFFVIIIEDFIDTEQIYLSIRTYILKGNKLILLHESTVFI